MEQFRKENVVLLASANHQSLLYFDKKKLKYNKQNNSFNPQHLYITTYQTWVEEGDYYYDTFDKKIKQCKSLKYQSYVVRKLIATTNTSLGLPQLSQQFIEKYINCYNKGEIITDILVEYESYCKYGDNCPSQGAYEKQHLCNVDYKLKINSDNTITTKRVKESWNREEVIELLKQAAEYGYENCEDNLGQLTDEWINEKL